MTHSRILAVIAGLAIFALASACDAEHELQADDTGVFTLESLPASEPDVAPPRDVTASDDTPTPEPPEVPEVRAAPRGEPDLRGAAPIDDGGSASDGTDRGEPTARNGADEATGADPAPASPEPSAQRHEPRPLAEQPDELVAFQSAVVALPPAFNVAMFTPPGHDNVTVVDVLTDRLRYDEAIIFMREALEQASWRITDQGEERAGLLRFEADRDGETVGVRVHLAVDAPERPQTVAVNVEHTR